MNEATQTTETATTPEGSATSHNVAAEAQVTATAEQKQAQEGQTAEVDGGGNKSDPSVYGAPEKYEFAPSESMDAAGLDAFSAFAKEANLSQGAAQNLLNAMVPAMAKRQAEALANTISQWAENSKNDSEFGGSKLDENLAVAKKARDQFATKEFAQFLDESGLGNHPEMIRTFYRVGKAISEDKFVGGRGTAKAEQSVAQRMYPNMNP